MSNGPIDGLLFAHHAIAAESRRLETVASHATTFEDFSRLAQDVAFLYNFVDKHTQGEEVGLFPALVQKVPNIDCTFVHDHADDREQFEAMEGLVDRCRTEGGGGPMAALRRQAISVTEHMAVHIRKENEILLPLVGQHFSPAEQGEMVQKILSVFSPADMEAVLPFIAKMQTEEGSVAYVSILAKTMPPPAFQRAKGWLQAGVPKPRWDLLVSRVEALR